MQLSVFAASDAKTEAVYGTPVIDGIIDDVWATANEEKIALVDKGVIPSETTTRGTFRTMWDENCFYVLIEVDKDGKTLFSGESTVKTDDCADLCLTLNGDFTTIITPSAGDDYAGILLQKPPLPQHRLHPQLLQPEISFFSLLPLPA